MNKLEQLEKILEDINHIKLSKKNPQTWVKVFETLNKGEAGFNEKDVEHQYNEWLAEKELELNQFVEDWNSNLKNPMTIEQILKYLKNE